MGVDPAFWRGKRVFVTGHTGFKGSWLSLWLQSLAAEVHGFALAPDTEPSLFTEANVAAGMTSTVGDIRDLEALQRTIDDFRPDIVLHLAAQPLVRLSYEEPVSTYATNVMGTVHLLESVRKAGCVRAVVNVTTDKCYENREWIWGYREDEPMGGHDPYSSSKGCSELVTSAYRRSFFQEGRPALASARAGNVIGGGDWASDRLVPDVLRAFERGEPARIRNPDSVRPWQHVLEPLAGYLTLAQSLWIDGQSAAEGWNFGPNERDAKPVRWIVANMTAQWGSGAGWRSDGGNGPHEANYLKLDISKARSRLGWEPQWGLEEALTRIVDWHRAWLDNENPQALCHRQIIEYTQDMNRTVK